MNSINEISRIAYEAIRIYDQTLGDYSKATWSACEQWQRDTVINGVKAIENGTVVVPKESHENWMKEKYDNGWKFGKVKDVVLKTHPCLVPFEKLSDEQRTKDYLFFFITKVLLGRAAIHLKDMK